jgi:hypothetical protein
MRRTLSSTIAVSWIAWTCAAHAQILNTALTIGDGWAAVRETRQVNLTVGEGVLVLTDIPAEAELSSLVVRTRRYPVRLIDWQRVFTPQEERALHADPDEIILYPDGAIKGHTGPSSPVSRMASDTVRCRVESPVGGSQVVEIIYMIRGIRWDAHYQALIRGDPEGPDETISMELSGTVRVFNTTDRTFENASIHIVGHDSERARSPETGPGILALDDGPLARLWNAPKETEIPLDQAYRMPHRVQIRANDVTELHWLRSDRFPATKLYVADTERVPLTISDKRRALEILLIFQNSATSGLGWALPPGKVEVYHGAMRRRVIQRAYLPHTPAQSEIRLHYGLANDVLGSRRTTGRTSPEFNAYEEIHQVILENNRPNEIMVEIHIRPDTVLSWDVVSSSLHVEQGNDGDFIMKSTIPGRKAERMVYRLRFEQPGL